MHSELVLLTIPPILLWWTIASGTGKSAGSRIKAMWQVVLGAIGFTSVITAKGIGDTIFEVGIPSGICFGSALLAAAFLVANSPSRQNERLTQSK